MTRDRARLVAIVVIAVLVIAAAGAFFATRGSGSNPADSGDSAPAASRSRAADSPSTSATPPAASPSATASPSAAPSAAAPSGSPSAGASPSAPVTTYTPEPVADPGKPLADQSRVLSALPGGTGCVAVGDRRDVRSGSLGMGSFDQLRQGVGTSVHVYVIPEDAASAKGGSLVATSGSRTVRLSTKQVETEEQFTYVPFDLTLPSGGQWKITADVAGASGCWTVGVG